MTLAPGNLVGPYEILELLGQGETGESFRARDTRLGRIVVVEALVPGRDLRALAPLHHPNLRAVYEIDSLGDPPYVAMELLEGEDLRTRLTRGPLPMDEAVNLATQIAQGLAAAHRAGLVHGALQTNRLFITREGRLKILGFGLVPEDVGSLSPEQVRGEPAGPASDLFSLGGVLFEMLTGRPPFRETAQILREDTPDPGPALPAGLRRILFRCLEKEPSQRFHDAEDLAFTLENVTLGPPRTRRSAAGWAWGSVAALVLVSAGWLGWQLRMPVSAAPRFTRVTYTNGTLRSARFGADGRTVYYSQRILGAPPETFVMDPRSETPKSLGLTGTLLLEVSPSNDLALMRADREVRIYPSGRNGMLVTTRGDGGDLRDVEPEVAGASWDGQAPAVLRSGDLEFPAGTKRSLGSRTFGIPEFFRISRDGRRAVVVEQTTEKGGPPDLGFVVLDREGRRTRVHPRLAFSFGGGLSGLAWGPKGDLWFSEEAGDQSNLWAIDLQGHQRLLWQGPGITRLEDVAPDGTALVIVNQYTSLVLSFRPGGRPLELGIQDHARGMGVSPDGRQALLVWAPLAYGGTPLDRGCLRPMDGGPIRDLGPGFPYCFSVDGHWVQYDTLFHARKSIAPAYAEAFLEAGLAAKDLDDPRARSRYILYVPTGEGKPWAVRIPDGFEWTYLGATPLRGGRQFLATLRKEGRPVMVRFETGGQNAQVLEPEGFAIQIPGYAPLSPDEASLVVTGDLKSWFIQPVAGGPLRPVPGVQKGEMFIRWSSDGKGLFFRSDVSLYPVKIVRIDPATGARSPILEFAPPNLEGLDATDIVSMTGDARTFLFTFLRRMGQLYRVEGLS